MNWTCCECENQVDERYYDLDEKMCEECLNKDSKKGWIEPFGGWKPLSNADIKVLVKKKRRQYD